MTPSRRHPQRFVLVAALCALSGACGASASFRGHRYSDGEVTYEVGALGSGWERLEVGEDNDLAWSRATGAIVQVNGQCRPDLDIPLGALVNHLLIGFTERAAETRETFPLAGREGLRVHLTAKLDGVPRDLTLVVVKKDGCVYDFALIAPPGAPFADASADFNQLLGGFRTIHPGTR